MNRVTDIDQEPADQGTCGPGDTVAGTLKCCHQTGFQPGAGADTCGEQGVREMGPDHPQLAWDSEQSIRLQEGEAGENQEGYPQDRH